MIGEQMLEKRVWAVVGATQNLEKYGNKIYRKLKMRGYKVYPVNPNFDTVDGDPCYKDLSALPEKPEVINMVVNPRVGEKVIEEAAALGVEYVWLQPGSHDEKLMDLIREKELQAIQACVLVALGG